MQVIVNDNPCYLRSFDVKDAFNKKLSEYNAINPSNVIELIEFAEIKYFSQGVINLKSNIIFSPYFLKIIITSYLFKSFHIL